MHPTPEDLEHALNALVITTTSSSDDGVLISTPSTSTGSSANNEANSFRYFDLFPGFVPNHQAPLKQEFGRLATFMHWPKNSIEWRSERLRCFSLEYVYFYGENHETNLQAWQDLCRDIALVKTPPSSIVQCKKMLKSYYVNIFDYIDCKRAGRAIEPIFRNLKQFWARTKKGRFFPLEATKSNPSRGALLEQSRRLRE